jgi:hypothetical protein
MPASGRTMNYALLDGVRRGVGQQRAQLGLEPWLVVGRGGALCKKSLKYSPAL